MADPSNDKLANATNITAVPTTLQQNTAGATTETNEASPVCLSNEPNPSVWFKYTPNNPQTIVFDTFGSDYDTTLSIWKKAKHPLTPIACNDDHSNLKQSLLHVELEAGLTYYINVGGYNGASGHLIFNAKKVNSLTNDHLADAITIIPDVDSTYSNTQTTQSATTEASEQVPSCNETGADFSVWYQYSPSSDQRVAFNTSGSDYNTVLSVWTGATHPLTEVACNDDNGSHLSQVALNLKDGKTYYINVAAGKTSPGSLSENTGLLVLNMILPPSNDKVANAILLEEPLPYSNTQTTGGATVENDEPSPSCSPDAGASVWYLFTPTTDYDNVTFSIPESSYDTVLSIWQGIDYPVTELGCNDNAVTLEQNVESQVTVALNKDESVYIDISGTDKQSGTVTLQVAEGETDFSIGSQPQSQVIEVCETANLVIGLKNKDGEELEITDDPIGNQWETGVTLPFVYKWYQGESGNDSTLIAEIENNPVFTPAPTETTRYWVRITNPSGSMDSESATVTVNGDSDTICESEESEESPVSEETPIGDEEIQTDEETVETNGLGIDIDGNEIPTTAHFEGSITLFGENAPVVVVNQTDDISVTFKIIADPNHVEQTADIIIVGIYTRDTSYFYMRQDESAWYLWDGNFANLEIAETMQLTESVDMTIYEGSLGMPGIFTVYVGYRLDNGGIFYTSQPITFTVE